MPNTAANNISSYDTFTLSSPLPSFNAFQENQKPEQYYETIQIVVGICYFFRSNPTNKSIAYYL
uniref:Putative ovule protein n=1 Tax=Solanum chacoense TaxID=4108 RepID=A0A0V0IFV1_SOLCH